MDGFGDFLGGLFEGAGEAAEWFGIEGPGGEAERPAPYEGDVPATYERYLAGGPRDLNINDL
jgi:hypothetical protein